MQNSLHIVIVIIINHCILMHWMFLVRLQCIKAVLCSLYILQEVPTYEFKNHNYDVQGLKRFIICGYLFAFAFSSKTGSFFGTSPAEESNLCIIL